MNGCTVADSWAENQFVTFFDEKITDTAAREKLQKTKTKTKQNKTKKQNKRTKKQKKKKQKNTIQNFIKTTKPINKKTN